MLQRDAFGWFPGVATPNCPFGTKYILRAEALIKLALLGSKPKVEYLYPSSGQKLAQFPQYLATLDRLKFELGRDGNLDVRNPVPTYSGFYLFITFL
jgi:hypothetical protein